MNEPYGIKVSKFLIDKGRRIFKYYSIRPMTLYMINHMKRNPLTGVEIGVLRGHNSYNILKNLPIKLMYLVDSYKQYENYRIYANPTRDEAKAHRLLKEFEDRIIWLKGLSERVAKDIPNGLDFVYIDGNHDYGYVKKDIELYWPKVRVGGILGGHDFRPDERGVVKAVLEWAKRDNLKMHGKHDDWWVVKE